jgi:hypothetical protein
MAKAKTDPAAALAARIVAALEEQRTRGPGAYPLTLAQLPALVGAETTPEQVAKALGKKPFAARFAVADKKSADSPLVLSEDAAALADGPLLLRFALNGLCTAVKPLQPFNKIEGRIDRGLRPLFAAALKRRLEANAWPSGVGVLSVKKKPHLYLDAYPPPPELVLPARLLTALQVRKDRGGNAYPPTLRQLTEDLAPVAPQTIGKVLAERAVKVQVVTAPPGPEALIALAADVAVLADSPALLTAALKAARNADNQALPPAALKKVVGKTVRTAFERSLHGRLDGGTLPDGVGCVRVKKTPHLFLWEDIAAAPQVRAGVSQTGRAEGVSPPRESLVPGDSLGGLTPPARLDVDVVPLFDDAFARLDRARGGHNLVSLVELRRALPLERSLFDQHLHRLRREGKFSLGAAEGRHGLTDEERQAGIVEDGTLLLFVSRRHA